MGKLESKFTKNQILMAYKTALGLTSNKVYATMAELLNQENAAPTPITRQHARYWASKLIDEEVFPEKYATVGLSNTKAPVEDIATNDLDSSSNYVRTEQKENPWIKSDDVVTITTSTPSTPNPSNWLYTNGHLMPCDDGSPFFSIDYLIANDIERNVLVIPDLHEPFTLKGYFEFIQDVGYTHGCNCVVFLGDILDNHFASFHETDPDGHSAKAELDRAVVNVKKWYKTFPHAKVVLGNHDAIPARKAFNAGLSTRWVRTLDEVLETPTWDFKEEFIYDKVLYLHGVGGSARNRCHNEIISIVQAHLHSKTYLEFYYGYKARMYALQLGSGIDRKQYAMAYAKHFPKPGINCAVIKNNGKEPMIINMEL